MLCRFVGVSVKKKIAFKLSEKWFACKSSIICYINGIYCSFGKTIILQSMGEHGKYHLTNDLRFAKCLVSIAVADSIT